MSNAAQAAQAMQQNLQLRQALLASAPPMRKLLGTFTGGMPGNSTRIKLFNVGITTRILLDISCRVDIGVAAATLSPKAPFNIVNRVKLTDFDSTDRINASGYQLWVLNSVRKRKVYGYNNASQTGVLTSPIAPVAVGANQEIRFQLEVPVAFDPTSDLRGAMMTQTAVGEAYVSIDWNNLLISNGNDDAVFNGSGTSTVIANPASGFSVTVIQEYLLPQQIGNIVPLPFLDLATVYEFTGAMRTGDNIAAGQEKLINYPNMRTVIGTYFNYLNNGVMNAGTDVSAIKLIANGNNVLREYRAIDKLFEQRDYMIDGADLRKGTYFELHRQKPIETALYGNMQIGFTPSSAVAGNNTNIEIGFESFFTKGSTLPGMSQSA